MNKPTLYYYLVDFHKMTSILYQPSVTLPSQEPSNDGRKVLLHRIHGSRVRISDLKSLLSHWPQGVHPRVGEVEEHVGKTLEWIFNKPDDEGRLCKMKAAKLGLFTASWWPYASFEALCVLATYTVWLFAWDDELDSIEFSPLINDLNSASVFREVTLEYLQESLTSLKPQSPKLANNPRLITGFDPVGKAMCRSYNDDQINLFLDEVKFFFKMCEEEQNTQALGHIPTVEEYMQRRMGSGAVRLNLALTEFATGSALPQDILLGDSIQAIWHEANVIICIMNDILSLKKEIAQLQVDSIVPLLLLKCGSLQAAVDEATHMAASSIDRLEAAERDAMNHYSSATKEIQEEIRLQIKACKLACTGNIHWSLISGRYYVQPSPTSNEVEMVL